MAGVGNPYKHVTHTIEWNAVIGNLPRDLPSKAHAVHILELTLFFIHQHNDCSIDLTDVEKKVHDDIQQLIQVEYREYGLAGFMDGRKLFDLSAQLQIQAIHFFVFLLDKSFVRLHFIDGGHQDGL